MTAGVDEATLLRSAGLSKDQLAEPRELIEHRHVRALWETASLLTGDSFFGAHAAQGLRLGAFGLIGFAVRSCANAHEAVERAIDWSRRFFPNTDFELAIEAGEGHFRHRCPPRDPPSRHGADYVFTTFLAAARKFTGREWRALRLTYQCSAPADVSDYERIYGAPVEFEAEWNSVVFERVLLDAPLAGSDPELLGVLSRHVEEFLAELPNRGTLSSQVRQVLMLEMNGGDLSLEATAEGVGLDPAGLQTRLWEEGTSHRRLLDGVRAELACKYLCAQELSLERIARSLGFDEPEDFARAFERWTGTHPARYRELERDRSGVS